MKTILYLLISMVVVLQFFCTSPEKAKNQQKVKYLYVTLNIPDSILVEVRTNFESIPTWCGCKDLSEQSWNWVPMEYSDRRFFSRKDKEICVPLFITKTTVCRWLFEDVSIGINRADSSDLTGFSIYPTADSALVLTYKELADTVRYECYKCSNQFMTPPDNDVFIQCDQVGREKDPFDFYTFDGIRGDTAYITIEAYHDDGPIRYVDTTLSGPNSFRVFGKDEKIPGLKIE